MYSMVFSLYKPFSLALILQSEFLTKEIILIWFINSINFKTDRCNDINEATRSKTKFQFLLYFQEQLHPRNQQE